MAQSHAHLHTSHTHPDLARHDHANHDHSHHDHAPHSHGEPVVRPARPPFSLLRLSAMQRLAGALAMSLALWAGVWWALQ